MFPRSRRIVVTLAATAALAGGAVAHAATGSSGSTADPATAPAAVVADDYAAADHAQGDCPNMGGDESTPIDRLRRRPPRRRLPATRARRPRPRRACKPDPCPHHPPAGTYRPRGAARPLLLRAAPWRVVVLLAALALLAAEMRAAPAAARGRARSPSGATRTGRAEACARWCAGAARVARDARAAAGGVAIVSGQQSAARSDARPWSRSGAGASSVPLATTSARGYASTRATALVNGLCQPENPVAVSPVGGGVLVGDDLGKRRTVSLGCNDWSAAGQTRRDDPDRMELRGPAGALHQLHAEAVAGHLQHPGAGRREPRADGAPRCRDGEPQARRSRCRDRRLARHDRARLGNATSGRRSRSASSPRTSSCSPGRSGWATTAR